TWITVTSGASGSGNGTINYTVASNPGNPRNGGFLIGGVIATINQASQCTYTANPTSANFSASGGSSSITVTNATGCNWLVNRGLNSWITITSSGSNTGNQTVTFTVAPNTGAARNGTITILENAIPMRTIAINQSSGKQSPFDFDGDNKTDIGIFRPNGGEWWYLRSSDGQNRAFPFGLSTDKLVPADFTGDGKNDVAFWRPSTGFWYVMRSEDNTFYAFPFGTNGDIPAPGDYDGDGKADVAVFRPSNATWYINKSSGGTTIQQFGAAGDLPNVADYDGDGKTDIAIFRPNGTNGAEWWILRSSNGSVFA
ncbi:MAG TPA: FG-GAP-like repeat-containing protein, partial [Pyrinomonadaceae bacterium]|nr:FG-GAP-like repeat-containing protein [Pyrinomonadaceae bacterium]